MKGFKAREGRNEIKGREEVVRTEELKGRRVKGILKRRKS